MKNNDVLVSIGLPVYNGGRYIDEAIASILSQTYTNIELVICDNASNDDTQKICERYAAADSRVVYIRNSENIGAARNFNKSFEAANGKYFKWASHDDNLGPRFIEECIAVLESRDDVVLCVPKIQYIDADGKKLYEQQIADISITSDSFIGRARQFFQHQISSDDIVYAIFGVIRSDALRSTGLWKMYVSCEEIVMFDLLWCGKLLQIDDTQFFFRIHSESAFRKNRKPKDRVKWFAPDKKVIFQFPVWYLMTRYISRIMSRPISLHEKAYGVALVLYRAVRLWKRYVGDIVKFFAQFFG